MKSVYLDNAATTQIDPEVIEAMTEVLSDCYGNPSSSHGFGRKAKARIETSRRQVADTLNASPAEIFFTSGGTEADNMAICCAVRDLGVTRIITSALEHHAVLHTAESEAEGGVELNLVNITENGHINVDHLEELLAANDKKTLVSLMHGNNEIGNLTDLGQISSVCRKHGAYFHSDTVQTMTHYAMDLQDLDIDFITCSAHKFHGPKGIGFLYVNSNVQIKPLIHGGAQERNMRGGTENIYGIVALAKAMEVAYRDMDGHHAHVQGLKTYMINELRSLIPGMEFNGDAEGQSLYTVLNCSFPVTPIAEMLLFNLDIMGISASGGSACTSGSNVGSHVLTALGSDPERPAIRFSFSKFTSKEDIDAALKCVGKLFSMENVG
ncbi:MAG: cysteine desulfurase [Flavobacteriales bacterium]|jgi:cysteine desulfurase